MLGALYLFLAGVLVFLKGYLTKISVNQNGLSYQTLFGKRKYVKFKDINNVKPGRIHGLIISWGEEKKRFWTLKPYAGHFLRIDKGFSEFKQLLKLIIERSANARIDPRIEQFLQSSNKRRITRISRRFAPFFLITLGIAIFSFAKFVIGIDSGDWMHFFYCGGLIIIVGAVGAFYSLMLYKWNGDKWLFLSNLFLLCWFYIFLFSVFFFNSRFTLLLGAMVGVVTLSLFICLLSFFPHFKLRYLLTVLLGLSIIIYWGASSYLLDFRVKTTVFGRIEDFTASGAGWFPDGSKIYIEGEESVGQKEQYKILIFDTASKKLIKNLPAEGCLCSSSFHWSPDGKKLALIEYLENKNRKLSLLDVNSLEKNPLLEAKSISLTKYSCWNQESTKLAGYYLPTEATEEDKTTAFVLNISTKEINTVEVKEKIQNVLWLPHNNLGIVHFEEKGKRKKERLFKYFITWVNLNNLKKEVIYAATEYCKAGKISPQGRFLFLRTKEDRPLIVDVFGKEEYFIEGKLSGECAKDIHWAPNERYVLFIAKGEDRGVPAVYGMKNKKLQKLLSIVYGILYPVEWSGDCRWFVLSGLRGFISTPFFLVSPYEEKIIKIRRNVFSGFAEGAVNYDGSKVIYYSWTFKSFGAAFADMRKHTTIFLSEITP